MTLIVRAAFNQLSNAMKFTDPGVRIDVWCALRDASVVITVVDTGIGIPANKLGAIFDPFVQVRSS